MLNWLLAFNDRYKADMTSQEILKSATFNSADLMAISKRLWTLEIRKVADIITMHASPFVDINELLAVDFVMKSDYVLKSK